MDSPVSPGDILLGKYRVERVLGKGGMGVVVAARHVDLGQMFAIKFLLPTMVGHQESVERFVREARAASRLESEHVAHVHDVGRMENGAPYMVMEFLDGCDLKALLTKRGPLPVEEAVSFVHQVCDAIAEAHELGIIHRDLKPANLFLVNRRNKKEIVKVLDFGISKHTGPEEVDLTNTNASFGSPLYMSPEQMARTKTVDGRTDIWALGTILYELLAGISPFKAATMTEVVARVLQEDPIPLRNIRQDIPPGLEAVVARCLQKRRDERFSSVREVAAALEPFGALPMRGPMSSTVMMDKPAVVAPVVPDDRTVPLPQPTAPAAVMTGASWGNTRPETVPAGRSKSALVAAIGLVVMVALSGVWFWVKRDSSLQAASAASGVSVSSAPVVESAPPQVAPPAPESTAIAAPEVSATAPAAPIEKTAPSKSAPKVSQVLAPTQEPTPPPAPTATATAAKKPKPMGFDD